MDQAAAMKEYGNAMIRAVIERRRSQFNRVTAAKAPTSGQSGTGRASRGGGKQ